MSNEIEIFNNSQFGNIRVQKDEDGEPLFCLADVCRALELTNPTMVAQQVCEEFELPKLNLGSFETGFGVKEMTMITEQQLYFVMSSSRKPNAKPFRMWVNTEVLPSIRKTGSYSITKTNMDIAIYSDDPLERGKAIVAMLEEERAKQALIEARADKAEEAKAIAEKKAEDLTEAFSRSIVSDKDKLYSTFIKELKMTTPCASAILKELKIFGKNGHFSDYGDWFKIKVSDNGFPARFVTPVGQMMLVNLFNANRDKMRAIGGTYRYIKPSDRCQIIKLPEDVCKNF